MIQQDLSEKSALVTGGSRGIGRAVALGLATRGAEILISYRDSEEAAMHVVAEIEAEGGRARAVQADQADPAACRRLVNATVEAFGKLDILVNNAGAATLQRLGEGLDWSAADRLWAVNTMGVIATIRAAAEVMADGGRIINLGSLSGTRAGMAGAADYCGSKAALAGYTRGAAHDLAPRKITVNIVEPGMIATEMALGMAESEKSRLMAAIPLNRFGDLEEITALVGFLASPAASYITGATLGIDGGLSA